MSEVCLIKSNEIVNGSHLFNNDDNIVSWDSELKLLENGYRMFYHCDALTDFRALTPKLANGEQMFCSGGDLDNKTIRFSSESLENGTYMFSDGFARIGMLHLRSNHQLNQFWYFPKLFVANGMFNGTKCKVYSQDSDESSDIGYLNFPALESGSYMFSKCRFDENYNTYFTFNSIVPRCVNYYGMFAGSNIKSFTNENFFSGLVGEYHYDKTPLAKVREKLSGEALNSFAVTDTSKFACFDGMFSDCADLTSFEGAAPDGISAELSDFGIDCNYMFLGCSSLANAQFSQNIMDNVRGVKGMFCGCSSLTEFKSSKGGNTVGMTNVDSMFDSCSNLREVELNMAYVTDYPNRTFYGCSALTQFYGSLASVESTAEMFKDLDNLANVYTKLNSVVTGNYMFSGCTSLVSVNDINGRLYTPNCCDFPSLKWGIRMFNNCSKLSYLYTNLSSLMYGDGMFAGCTKLDGVFGESNQLCHFDNLVEGQGMFESSGIKSVYGELNNLTNGRRMFLNCDKLSVFYGSLSSLTDGYLMFANSGINYFAKNNSNEAVVMNDLTYGAGMFEGCNKLQTVSASMPMLFDATKMFANCSSLATFKGNLNALVGGSDMFANCTNLTQFVDNDGNFIVLSQLQTGERMFNGCCLSQFDADTNYDESLKYLNDGRYMFAYCDTLSTFYSNLGSLTNGTCMFAYTNLSSFTGNLGKLTHGYGMFVGCKLNEASLRHIADTINDTTVNSNPVPPEITIDAEHDLINLTDNEKQSLVDIINKGWYIYFNGSGSGLTFDDLGVWVGTPYDIVEGSAYIPDASTWYEDNATVGAQVTSIHDGFAWNDNA